MTFFDDPLLESWEAENILFEIALREGFSPTCQFESLNVENISNLYRVSDLDKGQTFTLCLANTVPANLADLLKLTQDDLLICRDIALDDTTMANLALCCRLKTI